MAIGTEEDRFINLNPDAFYWISAGDYCRNAKSFPDMWLEHFQVGSDFKIK
jgi:hypothetical protein